MSFKYYKHPYSKRPATSPKSRLNPRKILSYPGFNLPLITTYLNGWYNFHNIHKKGLSSYFVRTNAIGKPAASVIYDQIHHTHRLKTQPSLFYRTTKIQ